METVKITKKAQQEFVKTKLGTSKVWAQNALLKIYDFQTQEEQQSEHTKFINGIGFTGVDGEILSSFAKQLQVRKTLSDKQMNLLFKKMPKYWKQIIAISDENQLNSLIAKTGLN